ncbi:MAG: hypothetical protein ABSC56_10490 [Solirubrobacteraceae bacterium]|jgi:hypothetical protein
MARVHVLSDDLLFGSRLQAELSGAGHDVTLGATVPGPIDALVLDLTHDAPARLVGLEAIPTVAFYSHVEADVREHALAAGIELVVPRSRMAREPAALLARALGSTAR